MIFNEQAQMILGIVISVATIVTIFAGFTRWLVKHYFTDIKNELSPNSGTSIKDQVTRLEIKTDRLEAKLEKLYEIIITKKKL
jgi:hypothetical protein